MMMTKKEKKRVPQLRFAGFEGEWVTKTLEEISRNAAYGMNAAATTFDGENQYLRITDIDEDSRTFLPNPLSSPEGDISEKFILKKGDIVFARTGASVGKSYLYNEKDGKLLFAGFLIRFNIDKANPYFVFLNTFLEAYNKWVSVYSMRSGQPGLNAEEYKLLEINLPSSKEQQKIAIFLTSIDTRIQQLEKKKTLLEQYKKGVMQKIFSQEIRFKPALSGVEVPEDGKEFEKWEKKRLGDVFKSISTRPYQIQSKDFNSSGKYKIVDQGKDLIAGYSDNVDNVFKDLPIVVFGDHTTIIKFIDFDFIVGADGTKLLKNKRNDNLKYLYYNLSYNNVPQEGYKRHFRMLSEVLLNIPCIEEQTKIAQFLSALDTKISVTSQQIEQTKEYKKGLMQKMFV